MLGIIVAVVVIVIVIVIEMPWSRHPGEILPLPGGGQNLSITRNRRAGFRLLPEWRPVASA